MSAILGLSIQDMQRLITPILTGDEDYIIVDTPTDMHGDKSTPKDKRRWMNSMRGSLRHAMSDIPHASISARPDAEWRKICVRIPVYHQYTRDELDKVFKKKKTTKIRKVSTHNTKYDRLIKKAEKEVHQAILRHLYEMKNSHFYENK